MPYASRANALKGKTKKITCSDGDKSKRLDDDGSLPEINVEIVLLLVTPVEQYVSIVTSKC